MTTSASVRLIKIRHRRKVLWRVALTVTVLLVVGVFIVGTPFALLAIGHLKITDWAQLSNEGQAYGGVAAVFGMLALVGVVASVILHHVKLLSIARLSNVRFILILC